MISKWERFCITLYKFFADGCLLRFPNRLITAFSLGILVLCPVMGAALAFASRLWVSCSCSEFVTGLANPRNICPIPIHKNLLAL